MFSSGEKYMKKERVNRGLLPICTVFAAGLFFRQLYNLSLSNFIIENHEVPAVFDGFRILQISDLHNNKLICHKGRLALKIKSLAPDVIFITGDIVDRTRADFDVAVGLARELVKICPVYYIPGNHEARLRQRDILFRQLKQTGVILLFDRKEFIERNNERISVTGIMDPRFDNYRSKRVSNNTRIMLRLRDLRPLDKEYFNILLAHRPENPALFSNEGYDLVFSGHAHGGQWRLPVFGALYAPGQGIFPEYTSGVHMINDTAVVISRGLGNSDMPVRINNPFELVVVTLKHKKD